MSGLDSAYEAFMQPARAVRNLLKRTDGEGAADEGRRPGALMVFVAGALERGVVALERIAAATEERDREPAVPLPAACPCPEGHGDGATAPILAELCVVEGPAFDGHRRRIYMDGPRGTVILLERYPNGRGPLMLLPSGEAEGLVLAHQEVVDLRAALDYFLAHGRLPPP